MAADAATSGGGAAVVSVGNSALFQAANSTSLNRTFDSGGNRKTWTSSIWFSRGGKNGGDNSLFTGYGNGSQGSGYYISNDTSVDTLNFYNYYSGGWTAYLVATPKFRDIGWYHIVIVWDTTQVVASERMRAYVNGERITEFSAVAYPSLNLDGFLNQAQQYCVGSLTNSAYYMDGYIAETVFIDGTAHEPSSFGEYDSTGLYWTPKSSTAIKALTFGTNGFYLDNTTNAQTDASGEGHNFTNVNTVTTSTHTPTNSFGFLNGLNYQVGTLTNGFRHYKNTVSAIRIMSTISFPATGKFYFEGTLDSFANGACMGIAEAGGDGAATFLGGDYAGISVQSGTPAGRIYRFDTTRISIPTSGTDALTEVADTLMLAVDCAEGKIWIGFYDDSLDATRWLDASDNYQTGDQPGSGNNATIDLGTTLLGYQFAVNSVNVGILVNFGDVAYTRTAPSGFGSLNTTNMATDITRTASDTNKYFQTTLYEGNGAGQRVGAFQPFDNTFTVAKSALFNVVNDEYFSRTFETPTDQDVWTLSWWMKTGNLAAGRGIIGSAALNSSIIYINNVNIYIYFNGGAGFVFSLDDSSQWYNIILTCNGSTLTCYVNGVSRGTASVAMGDFNSAVAHTIGSYNGDESHFDGYMADFIFVDGTVHSTSVFGQTDTSTNRWIPKDPTITLDEASDFGNNGFYLNFADSSALGDDISGNNHDFTNNNTVTQSTDSPTTNLAVLDANFTNATLLNGNRTSDAGSGNCTTRVTIPMTTGKFYWEGGADAQDSTNATPRMGIGNLEQAKNVDMGNSAKTTWAYNMSTNSTYYGKTIFGATQTGSAVSFTTSQVAQFAYDADAGKFWVGKDNTWLFSGNPATGANPTYEGIEGPIFPCVQDTGTSKSTIAIAEADWTYSAPTDFVALAQDNLAGTDQFISAFSWIKNRDATDNHMLFDRVRGVYKDLHSNTQDAEVTNVNTVQSFLEAGVQVGDDVQVNTASESYALWNWMIEATGSGASNEAGSINTTSTLVDTTLGLSISTYTGTGSNATIGHGLGVVPEFFMVNRLNTSGTDWMVYHSAMGATKNLVLNNTAAPSTSITRWNNTEPTSTLISLGTTTAVNGSSDTYVCYAFAPSQFISIGSYNGNANANGTFVPTFNSLGIPIQPVWVFVTSIGSTSNRNIYDNKRLGYNPENAQLWSNLTTAEATADDLDIVTGGLKMRITSDPNVNETYVYMAIGTPIIDTDGRIIAGR